MVLPRPSSTFPKLPIQLTEGMHIDLVIGLTPLSFFGPENNLSEYEEGSRGEHQKKDPKVQQLLGYSIYRSMKTGFISKSCELYEQDRTT